VIGTGMVILQSSMDLMKAESDSCDDNGFIAIKVEEVTIKEEDVTIKEEDFTDVKEEEDPLLIRVPLTGAEHEVSCLLQIAMSVSWSLHRKKFHTCPKILQEV
jgi:hypothetical protein